MSQSLGEKLRLAREERGISITEVAEATRISPHYLQAIEADDYRILPGGIFNKGFIKSFAKNVGVDEQEALADYARIVNADAEQQAAAAPAKTYRPEVLTDGGRGGSMLPTIIGAVVILGLITAAVLFGLNYLQNSNSTETANKAPAANANVNAVVPAATPENTVPAMSSLKVEFSATTDPVSVTSAVDGGKSESKLIAAGETVTFEPKESVKLSYSRSLAGVVKLSLNGKPITLPATPANPKRSVIEVVIDKDSLPAIWSSGAVGEPEAAAAQPASSATPAAAVKTEAANTAANTAANRTAERPANSAATPAASPAKRPAAAAATPLKKPEPATPAKKPAAGELQ